MSELNPGYVLLEDGSRFEGQLCGTAQGGVGEVVFNTAMTGYQEAVTDPSYAGQIITFTYPMVGNYGVSAQAMESGLAHARGVIMREAGNNTDAATAEGGWLDWLILHPRAGSFGARHPRFARLVAARLDRSQCKAGSARIVRRKQRPLTSIAG